jgi:DNA-binding NtrC family response regulator
MDVTETGADDDGLLERLKRAHPALRAIGVYDPGDDVFAKAYQGRDYVDLLEGPVAAEELAEAVRRVLT